MHVRHDVPLAPHTTLRLGGPARRLVEATDEAALVQAACAPDPDGGPVVVLAGGSNVVVADDGIPGTVVHVATRGVERREHVDGTVHVTAAAGEPWDELVARCVADGLAGLECLSGIPGSTGATPIQNVGAYGQEVAETLVSVRVVDRATGEVTEMPAAECGLRYRHSTFKGDDRRVVLAVTFALRPDRDAGAARYAELARTLGVEPGASVPVDEARAAVLALRGAKGMVLDPDDHDTWSAGSFFTNPILEADAFAELVARSRDPHGSGGSPPPSWPEADGRVKTSAAWLIERAGFGRGHRGPGGRVALSGRHTLAITNRGGATTADLVTLAREIRDGVRTAFGVALVPEPVFVGHAF